MLRKFLSRVLLVGGVAVLASALCESPVLGDTPKKGFCCQHAKVSRILNPNDPSTQFDRVDCGYRRSGISGTLACVDLGACNGELIDSITPAACIGQGGVNGVPFTGPLSAFVCRPNNKVSMFTLNDWVTTCSDTSGLAPGCLCVASLNSLVTAIVPDCGGVLCPTSFPEDP